MVNKTSCFSVLYQRQLNCLSSCLMSPQHFDLCDYEYRFSQYRSTISKKVFLPSTKIIHGVLSLRYMRKQGFLLS